MVKAEENSQGRIVDFSLKSDDEILCASNQWNRLQGSAYGLRFPPMVGFLAVGKTTMGVVEQFDHWLCQIGYLASGLTADEEVSDRLVHCFLSWFARLQQLARIPVFDQGKVISVQYSKASNRTIFELVLPCFAPQANMHLLAWLIRSLNQFARSSSKGGLPDFAKILKQLSQYKVSGVNAFHFLEAANTLRVPVRMLDAGIFCFGNGATSHWLQSSVSHQTSCLGVQIAKDKFHTARMLASAGIPVSPHFLVANSDEACKAAAKLGYPVVVKPADLEQGDGVSANIKEERTLLKAYERAAKLSKRILVEKHFFGNDYRLTVFHGKVIKVEQRISARIVGDGHSSIAQLVNSLQQTPRFQKAQRDFGKMMVCLDDEARELLEESGLTADSILKAGQFQILRKKNNISTGGTQELIPFAQVNRDNLTLAERAAAITNLDIAGIDLIIPDIGQSWLKSGAVICEVNSQPQIGKKTTPRIYEEIVTGLMDGRFRIPVHLVVQPMADGRKLERDRGKRVQKECRLNGLSTSEGLWLDDELIVHKPVDGFSAARMLLNNQGVQGAACVMTEDELLSHGLPCDWFESITIFTSSPWQVNSAKRSRIECLLAGHSGRVIWQ